MIRETSEKIDLIRRRMKVAQDRQKSYADKRRTDLEFEVGDMVFVKVSPLKRCSLWVRWEISTKVCRAVSY